MAWKRSDWNDIIQRVNDLSTNPPDGREALDPLDEVPEDHKWSVDDITTVRDRLLAICATSTFDADTIKWTQDIIDEIDTAIAAGWCGEGCEEDGTVINMAWLPAIADVPDCPYEHCCTWIGGGAYPIVKMAAGADIFNGLAVAGPNPRTRTWTAEFVLYRIETGLRYVSYVLWSGGYINPDGTLECLDTFCEGMGGTSPGYLSDPPYAVEYNHWNWSYEGTDYTYHGRIEITIHCTT